ncbi:MAG: carboxypeptidase regulatory-like domain-containing protein [Actinomycetota bacterium]
MRRSNTGLIGVMAKVSAIVAIATAMLFAAGPALAATPTPTPSGSSSVIDAPKSCSSSVTLGCVQGTLNDSNGNGIKGVKLTMSDATGDSATTISDANGRYVFSVTVTGKYSITLDTSSLPKGVTAEASTRTITATLTQLQPVVFPLQGHAKGSVSTSLGTVSIGKQIWDQFSQGLLLGLLLALASIGLSLIYGTTGLSNFAHAEQVTLGGLLQYLFAIQLGLNFFVAAVITVALCAATGYLQDRLIWGPLRKRGLGLTQLMVVTIGLSLALEYLYQFFFGSQVLPVTTVVQRNTGPLDITPNAYMSMAISVIVLVLVGFALQRTRIGRATRAVSDNRALAAASGIDVDRIIRLVWTVAMGLAGLSGVLYALVYGGIQWSTGIQLLLLIFAAVTLGGLGTAFGALVGSLVIGIVVQVSSLVLSSDLKYATALLILIFVLLFRPQGILGRRERVG